MKKISVMNLKTLNYYSRFKIVFLILLFLSVLIPMPVSATTYYVSTSGNDANPGTDSQPWRTIQKSASTLIAGDTVYIKSGIYAERVIPQNSGTAGNYITYASNPGDAVTIDGTGISVPEYSGLFDVSQRSYIRISGLRVINSGYYGILADGSSYITFENNYTYNTYSSGVSAWSSNHIIVAGNEVVGACTSGLQEHISIAGTDTFEVRNNYVHGHMPGAEGKEGICIKDGSSKGKIFRNQVTDLHRNGIYVDAWDKHTYNIEVYENLVHGVAANGLALASEQGGLLENIRVYNNIAYGNKLIGISVSNCCLEPPLTDPMKDIFVINNTLYNNGWDPWGGGIGVENPDITNVVILNNIVSQNLYFQIAVDPSVPTAQFTVDHNLIDGYRGTEGEVYGSNYVTGNPLFVNPAGANFRLQGSSPAIDTGSSINAPGNDFDGSLRPYGIGFDIGAYEYGAAAVPDIKINNSDGPITVKTSDVLSLTVSLNARNSSGINADWWGYAETPFGWYYYDYVSDSWLYIADFNKFPPTYQGPLFDLPSLSLQNITGLPAGKYTVYFGIDTSMNGQVDFEHLYYDSVVVNIAP